MNKTISYGIIVLVILAVIISIWFFASPVGAFAGGVPAFDFSLSANPNSGTVTQGQSTTSTITATLLKGKTKLVSLSASGCPTSTTCSVNPTTGYPTFYSTLTITTTTSTPLGTHTITINGVGGGKTRTTTYTLTVNPIPCNCTSWVNGACGAGGCLATQRQQTRTCTPSGCDVQSRCIDDPSCITNPDSCSDTDGGFVTTIKGTVSGYKNNNPYSYTDACISNTTLIEYYCSGTNYLNSTASCYMNTTTYCSNGACV